MVFRRESLARWTCLAAPLLGFTCPVFAGINQWTPLDAGPLGNPLCSIAVSSKRPETVYVGREFGGLFRSDDGGVSWTSTAPHAGFVACVLAVDAGDPGQVYLVDPNSGLQVSADGGVTWHPASTGLPEFGTRVGAIVSTPIEPSLLLASESTGAFRSLDRGASWEPLMSAPLDSAIAYPVVALSNSVSDLAYLAVDSGFFRSLDRGDHWQQMGSGLPEPLLPLQLLQDPSNGSRLFLRTQYGLLRSEDGGSHWSELPGAGSPEVIVAFSNGELFAFTRPDGELASSDHGTSWTAIDPNVAFPRYSSTTFAPSSGDLLAVGWAGIQRSNDFGRTWLDSASGMLRRSVVLRQTPRAPARVYSFQPEGSIDSPRVLYAEEGRAPWHELAVETPDGPATYIQGIEPDPQNASRLAALVALSSPIPISSHRELDPQTPEHPIGGPYYQPEGVLSEDGGATWKHLTRSGSCSRLQRLEFDPFEPNRLFALRDLLAVGCPTACFSERSLDRGDSWECMYGVTALADRLTGFAPSPFEPDLEIAWAAGHIVRSHDGGASWQTGQALALPGGAPDRIWWTTPERVEFSTPSNGYFRSLDRGASFLRLDSPGAPYPPGSAPLDRFHPDALFAIAPDSAGVLWKPSDIAQFRLLSEGFPGGRIESLVVDPVSPNRLIASIDDAGLWSYEIREPSVCVPSDTSVCLRDGRFRLEAVWHDFFGNSGVGHGEALSNESSSFWFFDPANLELFVKELDGLGVNHSFWTFFGALSNVEYTLLATDTATGAMHGYFNPAGAFASVGDVDSFPQEDSGSAGVVTLDSTSRPIERQRAATTPLVACAADDTTLCLQQGRFAVSVTWRDFQDHAGVGHTLPLTADTGSFWFFDAANTELVLKVLDGTGTNDAFWVFYGSLSNVTFDLTVTDTLSGDRVTYHNPAGQFASVGDILAFPQ